MTLVERLKVWVLNLGAKDYEVESLLWQVRVKNLEKKEYEQTLRIEELEKEVAEAIECIAFTGQDWDLIKSTQDT